MADNTAYSLNEIRYDTVNFSDAEYLKNSRMLKDEDTIEVEAAGNLGSFLDINSFYLYVPTIIDYGSSLHTPSSILISQLPSWINIRDTGENILMGTLLYKIREYDPIAHTDIVKTKQVLCYYHKYQVFVSLNSSQDRDYNLDITFKVVKLVWNFTYGYYTKDGVIDLIVSFTVNQKGISDSEEDEEPVAPLFLYRIDKNFDSDLLQPSPSYKYLTTIPTNITDSYSYKSSLDDTLTLNTFKYLYIRTLNNAALRFSGVSQVPWISITVASISEHRCVFAIEVELNELLTLRLGIICIKYENSVIFNIHILQYSINDGDDPRPPTPASDDVEEFEYTYWDAEDSTGAFSITDTNEGALIDPTLLLFKSNYANVYNTIEQKDGTLFLGNYINENSVNNVHDIMDSYLNSDKEDVHVFTGTRKVFVNLSGANGYSYVPDMTLNSQLKRIFKYGETYALGLVFVYKTGKWSSVYYLGNSKGKWILSEDGVSQEPLLMKETDTSESRVYYKKPVRVCVLSKNVTSALYEAGITAVIPVYAVKNTHSIMCQGYLSPTVLSATRKQLESIEALYSWFYRSKISNTLNDTLPTNTYDTAEILSFMTDSQSGSNSLSNNIWNIDKSICSLNTPEVEIDEVLSDAMLSNVKGRSVRTYKYSDFSFINNILMTVSGKYLHSYFSSANVGDSQSSTGHSVASILDKRVIAGTFWKGFVDDGYTDNNRLSYASDTTKYEWFIVYPWLRATIGGEGPTSVIENKRLLNNLYNECIHYHNSILEIPDIKDAIVYRDFDTASVARIDSDIYLGNTDYIVITEFAQAYKAWFVNSSSSPNVYGYPKYGNNSGYYSGYDKDGNIIDPISIKYKVAPHVVLKFKSPLTYSDYITDMGLFCVELYNPTSEYKTDTLDLLGYQWIKCGDLKRILSTLESALETIILFEEGDYFFGRYDSLRTYCYTENDVNSVVEIVSGMLCSKVNLDSRCDRNRGVRTPTVSPVNFNIFNPVYNLLNNYFTFNYIDLGDIVYRRKYINSILWSLTKEYSSDVDSWCNILDINTLDFDGDKGEIQAITKLGNNLIVFQDTGISQIQYNEKTLVSTSEGVPIEIANSNKVDGKYYLYDNIGCQYKGSISKSPNGIYFVDSINKSLYLLSNNAEIKDLCTINGMKSWGIANLNTKWWSYYDSNSLEILFVNDIEALAYSDVYQKFNAFLGYGGIRWNFKADDVTIQVCPPNFQLVIDTIPFSLNSSLRIAHTIITLDNIANSFWKKNSIPETKFFDNSSSIEILLHCNPEPTTDKTFSVVEYRMDCFSADGEYLENTSFDTFRAWNEYLDTSETTLKYLEEQKGPIYNTDYSTRLRKKFRIWRLDIPRARYGNLIYRYEHIPKYDNMGNELPPKRKLPPDPRISRVTNDRIRNPWCNILLKLDTKDTDIGRIVFNDLSIQYFK